MYKCEHTQSYLVRFEMCLKDKCFNCARFSINPTLILFGHDGKTTTHEGFDFILLHAKFFVYKCRLNKLKPTLETFINNFKHIYKVDKHVHLMDRSSYLLWFSLILLVCSDKVSFTEGVPFLMTDGWTFDLLASTLSRQNRVTVELWQHSLHDVVTCALEKMIHRKEQILHFQEVLLRDDRIIFQAHLRAICEELCFSSISL